MKKFTAFFLTLIFLLIPINNFVLAGRPAPTPTPTSLQIPVVCYHIVAANPSGGNRYQTSLAIFKEQIEYLNSNGYTTLSSEEYYNIMTGQSTAPSKPILLTFDDSTSDFYDNAFPVLKQYGMKAVQFVVTSWIDTAGHLTTSQLKELAANNIDIQNHTDNHADLSQATYNEKLTSISNANTVISGITGKAPQYLAYPYGNYDADTVTIAKSLGIKMGFKVGGGITRPTDDMFGLGRALIVSSDTLSTFIRKITGI